MPHFIRWFSFTCPTWRKLNFFVIHFLVIRSEQSLRMPWQHSSRVICKNGSDLLIRFWVSWSRHKLTLAKFESEKNELLTEFKFWRNNRQENGSLARMYFSQFAAISWKHVWCLQHTMNHRITNIYLEFHRKDIHHNDLRNVILC